MEEASQTNRAATKLCHFCRNRIPPEAVFCGYCGCPVGANLVEPTVSSCPTCGKSLDDNSVFCGHCGAKLEQKEQIRSDATSQSAPDRSPDRLASTVLPHISRKNQRTIAIVLTGALALLLIVVVAVIRSDRNSKSSRLPSEQSAAAPPEPPKLTFSNVQNDQQGYADAKWDTAITDLDPNAAGEPGSCFVPSGDTEENEVVAAAFGVQTRNTVVAGTVLSTSLDFSVVPAKCKSISKGDVKLIFYDDKLSMAFSHLNAHNYELIASEMASKFTEMDGWSVNWGGGAMSDGDSTSLNVRLFKRGNTNTRVFLLKQTDHMGCCDTNVSSVYLLYVPNSNYLRIREDMEKAKSDQEAQRVVEQQKREQPDLQKIQDDNSADQTSGSSSTDSEQPIKEFLNRWVESSRNRDVDAHSNCYAPVVETYFAKHNVANDQLRGYKNKAFSAIAELRKFEISDVSISADPDGRYSVKFRKSWDTTLTNGKLYTGETIDILKFQRFGSDWKIVSEEEPQVLNVVRQRLQAAIGSSSSEVNSVSPNDNGISRIDAKVVAPKAIYTPDPEYSKEAREAKIQGTCLLWLIVGADGNPRDIKVQKSLGKGLDEKAIEAVKIWKFEPATKDGQPVAVQINVEVSFRLH